MTTHLLPTVRPRPFFAVENGLAASASACSVLGVCVFEEMQLLTVEVDYGAVGDDSIAPILIAACPWIAPPTRQYPFEELPRILNLTAKTIHEVVDAPIALKHQSPELIESDFNHGTPSLSVDDCASVD
ncbi:MAG: hypothetical protein ACM3SP_00930 [Chloroflexota bacterium]